MIYEQNAALLNRYHGGMPVGFVAATIQRESDGRMDAKGDVGLGEAGWFQVSAHAEDNYGLPRGYRLTKLGNTFTALLQYNVRAAQLNVRYPSYAPNGSRDQWLLSRLTFAIGQPGTYRLLDLAKIPPGDHFYERFIAWAQAALANGTLPKLGSQSPSKVAFRVAAILDMWKTGQLTGLDMTPGMPVIPPFPPGLKSISIPKEVRDRMPQATGGEGPEVVRAEDLQVFDRPEASAASVVLFAGACAGVSVGLGLLVRRLG